ncbi:MAG: hypothetical protein II753_05150, partial [Spirochaetales bacterium]|nr:hypothetical protein [Spirochaetales bacterium]
MKSQGEQSLISHNQNGPIASPSADITHLLSCSVALNELRLWDWNSLYHCSRNFSYCLSLSVKRHFQTSCPVYKVLHMKAMAYFSDPARSDILGLSFPNTEAPMSANVRPSSMQRITTAELANAFIDQQVAELRAQIGTSKVLLALSGGVDSSVVAALLIKAVGKQLVCVHVNH